MKNVPVLLVLSLITGIMFPSISLSQETYWEKTAFPDDIKIIKYEILELPDYGASIVLLSDSGDLYYYQSDSSLGKITFGSGIDSLFITDFCYNYYSRRTLHVATMNNGIFLYDIDNGSIEKISENPTGTKILSIMPNPWQINSADNYLLTAGTDKGMYIKFQTENNWNIIKAVPDTVKVESVHRSNGCYIAVSGLGQLYYSYPDSVNYIPADLPFKINSAEKDVLYADNGNCYIINSIPDSLSNLQAVSLENKTIMSYTELYIFYHLNGDAVYYFIATAAHGIFYNCWDIMNPEMIYDEYQEYNLGLDNLDTRFFFFCGERFYVICENGLYRSTNIVHNVPVSKNDKKSRQGFISLKDIVINNGFIKYHSPNPENLQITLHDIFGNVIYETYSYCAEGANYLDLSPAALNSGLYFIRFTGTKIDEVKKFIIVNN